MDGISFFLLNGFILGLFPADELAKDIGIEPGGTGFKSFTLAVNFSSEEEVNQTFEQLKLKGVQIVKSPEKFSGEVIQDISKIRKTITGNWHSIPLHYSMKK
jgi:hypothetical protein